MDFMRAYSPFLKAWSLVDEHVQTQLDLLAVQAQVSSQFTSQGWRVQRTEPGNKHGLQRADARLTAVCRDALIGLLQHRPLHHKLNVGAWARAGVSVCASGLIA